MAIVVNYFVGDCGDGIDGDGYGDGVFVSSTLSQIMVFKFEGAAVEEELGWRDKKCVIGAINGNCVMMALLQTLPTASSHFGGGVMVSVPWF